MTDSKMTEQIDDPLDDIPPFSIQDQLAISGARALPVKSSSAPASMSGIEEDIEAPIPRSIPSELGAMSTSNVNPQGETAVQEENSPAGDQSKTQAQSRTRQRKFRVSKRSKTQSQTHTQQEESSAGDQSKIQRQSHTQQESTSSLPPKLETALDKIKAIADEAEKMCAAFTSAASTGSSRLTHLNTSSEAQMVSIASKKPTKRIASAIAYVPFSVGETLSQIRKSSLEKGDVLAVSRVAGIMAVKKASDIVVLAHPGLAIEAIDVLVEPVGPESVSKSKDTPDLLKEELEDRQHKRNFESMLTRQMGRGIGFFGGMRLACTVQCNAKTGVEMEALAGVTAAALSVIDMCKSIDKELYIGAVKLVRKEGGRTGPYMRLYWD